MALGGDAIPARCLANWFLGNEIHQELRATYLLDTHKTTIDTVACLNFLTRDQLPVTYNSKLFFELNRTAIKELAEGEKLWDENMSEDMQKFEGFVKTEWLIIVSNAQLVER